MMSSVLNIFLMFSAYRWFAPRVMEAQPGLSRRRFCHVPALIFNHQESRVKYLMMRITHLSNRRLARLWVVAEVPALPAGRSPRLLVGVHLQVRSLVIFILY